MVLKFYKSVTKELKLKVKQFWELIPTFVEITGKKPEGGPIWPSIMNRVKSDSTTHNYKKSNLLPTSVPVHLSARRRQ